MPNATLREYTMAALANSAYDNQVQNNELPKGWALLSVKNTNAATGFAANAYFNETTKEIVIAYRGSEITKDMIDWKKADFALLKDGDPDKLLSSTPLASQIPNAKQLMAKAPNWDAQFTQGLDFADEIIKKYGANYKISVTGHSLGGSIAQVASKMHNLPGVTFDPAGARNVVNSDEFKIWASAHGKPTQGLGNNGSPTNYIVNKSVVSNYSGAHVGPTLPISGIAKEGWQARVSDAWSRHSMPRILMEVRDSYFNKRELNIIGANGIGEDLNTSRLAAADIYKNNVLNKTTVAVNELCDSIGFSDSKIRGNLSHGMTCAALESEFAGKGTYTASLNGNNINLIEELSVGNRNYATADSKQMGNTDQSVYQAKIAEFTPSDKTLGINVDQVPTINRSQSV